MDVVLDGRRVTLGPHTFLASGGEADVHAHAGLALKVFTDPTRAPSEGRLDALRSLDGPGRVVPRQTLFDPDGRRVGFTMELLDGWFPLLRLVPPAYQRRMGLDLGAVGGLLLRLRGLVAEAHALGAVIADLNEVNILVRPDHRDLASIDVDSWAIGPFPATALAESVRDRHASRPGTGSDWFAFAVVAFQVFVGMHPYRGRHPSVRDLDGRMQQDLSVFHPDVVVPPMVDLGRLPTGWRSWFEAVLAHRDRSPPPQTLGGTPLHGRPRTDGLHRQVIQRHDHPIRGAGSTPRGLWTWTDAGLYLDGRRLGPPPPRGARPLGGVDLLFLTLEGTAVIAVHPDGTRHPTGLAAQALVGRQGQVLGRSGRHLSLFSGRRLAGRLLVTGQVFAQVPTGSTTLFPGCAVTAGEQGTWLHRPGRTALRIRGLDDATVVDADSVDEVAVLTARRNGGISRFILRGDEVQQAPTDVAEASVTLLDRVVLVPNDDGFLLLDRLPGGPARTVPLRLPDDRFVHRGSPAACEGPEVALYTLGAGAG